MGQLLLRSIDRPAPCTRPCGCGATRGNFPTPASAPLRLRDGLFLLGAGTLLILARCYDLPACLGRLLVGL